MKRAFFAISPGLTPSALLASCTRAVNSLEMCSTSSRVPWNAELTKRDARSSAIGVIPRSAAASGVSKTNPTAPMPMIMPWRRRSNGRAASSTFLVVVAAPEARKPDPIHSIRLSEVASSAPKTITRLQRPNRIQSWASEMPCVVDAHAALTCVFGPLAPMNWANCECPIERI